MNGTHHRLLLLRKVSSRVFTNINTTTNQWQSGAGTNPTAYATDYTYDAMGNILTQKRNGGGASATALDELTYIYHTTTDGLVSNRLYQVNDVVSAGNYTDDIDDQGTFNNTHSTIETANNYGYDELGNLVRDVQEEIASIEWTVYGKMKKITRNSGSSKADLEFGYDASGNRLWKKVTPKGSGAAISTYYYLRDAQGNEMCRYVKYTNTTSQLMYVAQEHSIYGSSRVGVDNRKDTLYLGAVYTPTWGGVGTSRRDLGSKSFELANHLGNVLVTVSDKPVYKVSSTTIFFQPEITSSSDYYPFGAPINGRGYATEAYRFGFNTQEKTDEISGTGNHFTAQFWEYDGRLGRRWNLDPVDKPWESLYACLSDNPVSFIDKSGDDVVNGDRLTADKKKVAMGEANNRLSDFKENHQINDDTKRKDFLSQGGAKQEWKKYEGLIKEAEEATKEFNRADERAEFTQGIIDKWKISAPNLFFEVDNQSTDFRLESFYFDPAKEDAFGITWPASQNVNGILQAPKDMLVQIAEGVNVSSKDPETEEYSLNHEAGHFLYIVKFTAEYARYYAESVGNNTYVDGGHGETNESGKVATKYGNLKDIPSPSPDILLKGN